MSQYIRLLAPLTNPFNVVLPDKLTGKLASTLAATLVATSAAMMIGLFSILSIFFS
jgi:hypothetical protein